MTVQELSEPISVEMIKNFAPVGSIFKKYIPQLSNNDFLAELPPVISYKYLIEEKNISSEICEQIYTEKKVFDEQFRKLMEKEAAEFGVPFNLDDAKHQWSNHDVAVQEACVSRIEEIYSGRKNEIIFYGPSNIQMWYSLEDDMYPYKAQNHGMGGCIDSEMMKYADRMLYAFEPSVVFFQNGSNDLASGISIDKVIENKKKMYGEFMKNLPKTKLVVMSGLPLPGRMELWEETEKVNGLLAKMCKTSDRLYYMDATDCFIKSEGDESYRTYDGKYFCPEYYRADKIHLNKLGHDLWTEKMKNVLNSMDTLLKMA